ncbi:MAG: DUF4249 family protein [Bacteroidota bacterium]
MKLTSYKYHFFIVLLSLSAISCESFFETSLELEEPLFETQLNINAIVDNVDNSQKIIISKTIGLNERLDSSIVGDADVRITNPDGEHCVFELSSLFPSSFNYRSICPSFEPNIEYTIRVDVPRENLAGTATAIMPVDVNFTDVIYEEMGGLDNDGNEVSAVDLIINDPPGISNFYKFRLFVNDNTRNIYFGLDSNDALVRESADFSSVILSDNQFDGEEYKLRLLFSNFYGKSILEDGLTLQASTISEDQFEFDKRLNQYLENTDNPFATVTQLYDNIDGGIGIFAIQNTKLIEVE